MLEKWDTKTMCEFIEFIILLIKIRFIFPLQSFIFIQNLHELISKMKRTGEFYWFLHKNDTWGLFAVSLICNRISI